MLEVASLEASSYSDLGKRPPQPPILPKRFPSMPFIIIVKGPRGTAWSDSYLLLQLPSHKVRQSSGQKAGETS